MIIKVNGERALLATDPYNMKSLVSTDLWKTILNNRGITDEPDIEMALNGTLDDLHDAAMMLDSMVAAETIVKHIKQDNHIVIYSDYDADGAGSIVVAMELLQGLGAKVDYFTNTRAMGYGANPRGVDAMLSKYPDVDLVVTTDNGIVAFDAVEILTAKGIEVIVTDHHQPSADGRLPACTANVNPHRIGDPYPFKGLCGAGVIWKVMTLVYQLMGRPKEDTYKVLDVLALSTVGDVVPLRDENRIIVKYGLRLINENVRPDWRILCDVNSIFGYEITVVDARTLAFTFVPQVNACSRLLGTIDPPVEMFLTSDENIKREKAEYIKEVNLSRKSVTEDQTERAFSLCMDTNSSPVIVVNNPAFNDGVVGLIAGNIKEAFWTPAIVLTNDPEKPGILRGSGRSIQGFPLKAVLDEIQNETGLLAGYGGHDMACGCSLPEENLEAFKVALNKKALERLTPDSYVMEVPIDVDIADNNALYLVNDALEELEPYGCDFESPIVRLKNFVPRYIEQMGKEKNHLKMTGNNITVISWKGWEQYEKNGEPGKVTCCGRLEVKKGKINLICDPELVFPA